MGIAGLFFREFPFLQRAAQVGIADQERVHLCGGGTAFGAKKAEPDDPKNLGTAIGAGVKIDPVAFLIVKDGFTRVMPVAAAPLSTIDRVVEMVPGVVDQVANFIDSRKKPEDPPVEEPC